MSDFTEAARAAAKKRADLDAEPEDFEYGLIVKDFMAGAKWARDHLAVQETDGERAVRELHTPREEQVVTGDCSIEECDHEDECPTVPFLVCAECWRVADECDTYFSERGVEHVAYPCLTIRALDSARAARRDKEKR